MLANVSERLTTFPIRYHCQRSSQTQPESIPPIAFQLPHSRHADLLRMTVGGILFPSTSQIGEFNLVFLSDCLTVPKLRLTSKDVKFPRTNESAN